MAAKHQEPEHWHRLDNTANLFPVITGPNYANVYRLALILDEPVDPELLQLSLDTALPWFSAFRVRMRTGFFWHYLEHNPARAMIQPEEDAACRYIDPKQNNGFLFRVTYLGRRVNLEVFHALTDGTGALRFLGAIICQYLMQAHPAAFSDEDKARRWFAQHATNTQDGYVQNYTPTKKSNYKIGKGYRLRGEKLPLDELSVIHANIELSGLKALSKEKGVTITHYICAAIAWGIYTGPLGYMAAPHPVNILVPVNLRPFFKSETSLNFFSNIYVTIPFNQMGVTFEDVLQSVKQQFEEKITREEILEKISYTVGSGYSKPIRMVPLPLKHVVLGAIYKTSSKSSTLSFTNVGVAALPKQFAPYVTGAYVLLSPSPRNPFQCAALSYGNTFTLSFTSKLRDPGLARTIIRKLADVGLDITVETNGVDYESM